mgnify:CR=1 FL=1
MDTGVYVETNGANQQWKEEINRAFKRARLEFSGVAPECRPKLPRQIGNWKF